MADSTSKTDRMLEVCAKYALPSVTFDRYHDYIMVRIPDNNMLSVPEGYSVCEYVLFDPTLRSGLIMCKYYFSSNTDEKYYEHLIPVETFFSDPVVKALCIFMSAAPDALARVWH